MRYVITVDMPYSAKAQLRSALRMMGAQAIRINEAKDKVLAPIRSEATPTLPEALAIAALFGRQPETEWSVKEIDAFKKAFKRGVVTIETVGLITKFYRSERKLPENHCRTSVLTLMLYWDGELDKARQWKPKGAGPGWIPGPAKPLEVVHREPTKEEREAEARFRAELDERLRIKQQLA